MTISDVKQEEHNPYYRRYIDKLPADLELLKSFTDGSVVTMKFFQEIPEVKLLYQYESEKWTIKEILQHLIDTERIFIHRCFRIARRDTTALAGFNQEIYIAPSGANHKSIEQLLDEYQTGRENSICILKSLSDDDLAFVGDANGGAMSARAAAFTIPGHDIWHMEIIKERYL